MSDEAAPACGWKALPARVREGFGTACTRRVPPFAPAVVARLVQLLQSDAVCGRWVATFALLLVVS